LNAIANNLSDYSDVSRYDSDLGTFVSLYAGAGGLDIGFALAGFRPVWVSELDPSALATHDLALEELSRHHPHLAQKNYQSFSGDLLAIPESQLPARGSATLVIGGPPCQGFSVAGKMDPNDERSKHVFHFMDIVERVDPQAFVMENVKALYANKRWSSIKDALILRAQRMGYEVKIELANAAYFGVPQARERMFLTGIKKGLGVPVSLKRVTEDSPPTVRDALAQLPRYGTPGNDSKCTAQITLAKSPVLRRSPHAGMLFNGAGRPLNLDRPSVTLPASMGGNKTPIIDQILLDDPEVDSWVASYHARLWSGNAFDPLSFVPSSLRRLTVEEAAALQTFPISMKWVGSQSMKFRQIGNAVPPRLALAVATAIKKGLRLD